MKDVFGEAYLIKSTIKHDKTNKELSINTSSKIRLANKLVNSRYLMTALEKDLLTLGNANSTKNEDIATFSVSAFAAGKKGKYFLHMIRKAVFSLENRVISFFKKNIFKRVRIVFATIQDDETIDNSEISKIVERLKKTTSIFS